MPGKWQEIFSDLKFTEAEQFLKNELNELGDHISIYPPKNLVLNAFQLTSPEKLKVVILGQDPYINEGEAMGLAFSVPKGKKIPPSLKKYF